MSGAVSQRLTLKMIDEPGALRALSPQWNALLAKAHAPTPFLAWEWVESWWQCYGAAFELALVAVFQGDELLAVSPTVIRRASAPRLEFIGQNRAYGEYLDVIVAKSRAAELVPLVAQRLADLHGNKWQCANLGIIRKDGPGLDLLATSFEHAGLPLRRSAIRASPVVRLGQGWDAYLATRGAALRARIRYNRRRLERLGPVTLEVAASAEEAERYFETYVELSSQRWGQVPDPAFLAFHRKLVPKFYRAGHLLLAGLRVGGALVAMKYDYAYDGRVWGYQGGWRPDFAKYEVGSVLLCELFQFAIKAGYREYDFLEGEDWYKTRWSTHVLHARDLVYGKAGGAYVF